MQIDLHTLVFTLVVVLFVQILVFIHLNSAKNAYKGTGWWLGWSIAQATGFGFMLLWDIPSIHPFVVIVQNSMIIAGTVFLFIGVKQFFDNPVKLKLIVPFIVVFGAGLLFYLFIYDSFLARSCIINSTIAFFSFLTAYILFFKRTRNVTASAHFNGTIFVGHGAVFVFRTMMIITGTRIDNIYEANLYNLLPYIDVFIVSLLSTFGFIMMINQRMKAEMLQDKDELRETESRFRVLFKNMSEGVALHEMIFDNSITPVDYRILDVNEAYEKQTTISANTARGALASELYNTKSPPYLQEYYEVVLTGKPLSFETHFREMNKDFNISVISTKPGYFATIFQDITEHKARETEKNRLYENSERSREALLSVLEDQLKVQDALHESNDLLSMFIKHSPIFAYIKEVTSIESRVLMASENFSEMIGIPGSQMAGKTMFELFPHEFANKISADDWAVASNNTVISLDEELNGRNFTTIKFPIRVGIKTLLAGYTIDITDHLAAENEVKKLNETLELRIEQRTAQLESANKEMEAFSYSVSHDLRAPLRHINGFVDLLKSRHNDSLPEKGQHYLDSIAESAKQMGMLIEDLLQFSRSGQQELRQTHLDMNLVFQEAMRSVEVETEGRNIEWNLVPFPHVMGDYNLLHMVWINLLSNAIKFTMFREMASIETGYRNEKRELVFYIKDNGAGFDMKYADKLFGVFQRLHSSGEFEGNGIGLANVRRIIAKHGGRTWAEAELDKGATFYFSLPKKAEGINHKVK